MGSTLATATTNTSINMNISVAYITRRSHDRIAIVTILLHLVGYSYYCELCKPSNSNLPLRPSNLENINMRVNHLIHFSPVLFLDTQGL